jgi:hypothetical protein
MTMSFFNTLANLVMASIPVVAAITVCLTSASGGLA